MSNKISFLRKWFDRLYVQVWYLPVGCLILAFVFLQRAGWQAGPKLSVQAHFAMTLIIAFVGMLFGFFIFLLRHWLGFQLCSCFEMEPDLLTPERFKNRLFKYELFSGLAFAVLWIVESF